MRRLQDSERPRLMAIAMRLLRDAALAEEAVQETMVKVWARETSFQGDRGTARACLIIIRNTALNILRSEKRQDHAADDDFEALQHPCAVDETAPVRRSLDPTLRLRVGQEAIEVRRRNGTLLAYVHGDSQGAIAGPHRAAARDRQGLGAPGPEPVAGLPREKTLEDGGGSAIGRPTGPILEVGRARLPS